MVENNNILKTNCRFLDSVICHLLVLFLSELSDSLFIYSLNNIFKYYKIKIKYLLTQAN